MNYTTIQHEFPTIPQQASTLYTHLGKWKRSLAPEGLNRERPEVERSDAYGIFSLRDVYKE